MTQEQLDDAVQASRDQGIRDACANAPAAYRFWHDGALCARTRGGGYLVIEAEDNSIEYRSAFAYARAYCAERGE